MQKQLTVTLEEQVYEGLLRVVGRENISQFINGLVRPHVVKSDVSNLEEGYRAMAADEAEEAARLAAIDARYGISAERGASVDEFLAERHTEGESTEEEGTLSLWNCRRFNYVTLPVRSTETKDCV